VLLLWEASGNGGGTKTNEDASNVEVSSALFQADADIHLPEKCGEA